MPDYQWAVGKGRIVTADYDRSMALSAGQVEDELKTAIGNLFDGASVSPVSDEFKEVYKIVIPREAGNQTFFVCLKATTPGGRSNLNLQNEQRIQQKAKYLNYASDRKNEGNKAACLGVYKHDSDTVFCAWNINPSTASPETPVSKQIKITTIARALTEGFVQQMSGSGEYVCAFRKEFIYFYLINAGWIHNAPISRLNDHNREMIEEKDPDEGRNVPKAGANLLFYGVPGAGKSHEIDRMIVRERSERVVFHPDYTYSDFVGQILPRILRKDGEAEGKLRYVFEPGPFTRMFKKAHDDPANMYFLVIEEINRGNAPAIFGDIFQMLDRNDDGSGKYPVANYDMAKAVYGDGHEDEAIQMPANLTLLATMNTSDQNVFTLDTAFQRRWEMHLIKNDVSKAEHANRRIEGSRISWGSFVTVTNEELIRFGEETGGSEDKRLGAYFARGSELTREKFPEKVLKYLWDDAFKMDHYVYFHENISSIDGIIDIFEASQPEGDILRKILKPAVYQKMLVQTDASENAEEAAEAEEVTDGESFAL